MEKTVGRWLKESLKYLGAAITAAGVSLGTQYTDTGRLADHERRIAENERRDEAAHTDCAHFRSVDLSGFCDPRAVHAIDQQIERALREYETREHAQAWRKRLQQLNPSLKILDE